MDNQNLAKLWEAGVTRTSTPPSLWRKRGKRPDHSNKMSLVLTALLDYLKVFAIDILLNYFGH